MNWIRTKLRSVCCLLIPRRRYSTRVDDELTVSGTLTDRLNKVWVQVPVMRPSFEKMKRPGKNLGYGNRGKTNRVFPSFPQPLLLTINLDEKRPSQITR